MFICNSNSRRFCKGENHRFWLELKTDMFTQRKRDQTWNQPPQGWLYVALKFFYLATELRFKTVWDNTPPLQINSMIVVVFPSYPVYCAIECGFLILWCWIVYTGSLQFTFILQNLAGSSCQHNQNSTGLFIILSSVHWSFHFKSQKLLEDNVMHGNTVKGDILILESVRLKPEL
jgi:hypothetical protein